MLPSLTELTRRYLRQVHAEPIFGDVVPHEVASAFRVEPSAAWQEAVLVLGCLGLPVPSTPPPEWSEHVHRQSPVRWLPMGVGHYPQMVSDFSAIFDGQATSTKGDHPSWLPSTTEAATINARGVAAFAAGEADKALACWQSLPSSAVKHFNLGVGKLVNGNRAEAREQLTLAARQLPDTSGWKALANLYITLAEDEDSSPK